MISGMCTALITPFNESGQVDYDCFGKLIDAQLGASLDSLLLLGTTGESPAVNDNERREITRFAVKKINKKVPVILGTGGNQIEKVFKYNEWAYEDGADGVLVVSPYYNKTSQEGLVKTFSAVSEKSKLPVILYNVPSRTGVNILPETVVRIAEMNKNVIGIKEASGDISQIARLIALKPKGLLVVSGNDDQILPVLALGGHGAISVISNICPREMKELVNHIRYNEMDQAREMNNRLNNLMNLLFIDVNPIPVKYAASLLGFTANRLRLPLIPLSEKDAEKVKSEMKKVGLI